jgi:hypothetical protein
MTSIPYSYDENSITVTGFTGRQVPAATSTVVDSGPDAAPRNRSQHGEPLPAGTTPFGGLPNALKNQIKQKIYTDLGVELAPSAAIAGVYAAVDSSRGYGKPRPM